MPRRPKRPCNYYGCKELITAGGYCEAHKKLKQKQVDSNRGTSTQRGYNSVWRKARKRYLAANPICVECEREGKLTASTEVDHIIPHQGDMDLFWDEDNWQALCKSHHSAKTAREDGGFGRGDKPRGLSPKP